VIERQIYTAEIQICDQLITKLHQRDTNLHRLKTNLCQNSQASTGQNTKLHRKETSLHQSITNLHQKDMSSSYWGTKLCQNDAILHLFSVVLPVGESNLYEAITNLYPAGLKFVIARSKNCT
jgi:hypothetical protein